MNRDLYKNLHEMLLHMYIKLSKLVNFISNMSIIKIDQLNVMWEKHRKNIFDYTKWKEIKSAMPQRRKLY